MSGRSGWQGNKQDLTPAGEVWGTTAGDRVVTAGPSRSAAPTAPHCAGQIPGRRRGGWSIQGGEAGDERYTANKDQ